MKFNHITLRSYGPFKEKQLDFTDSDFGLHIILGENEAGKSSSMRAIEDLLFGVPHKSLDGWRYGNNNLAIAANITFDTDESLELIRFKRRKNDLLELPNEKPFPQHRLISLLGNLNRNSFNHTFGISHDSLRLGVESILAAGGDLGQTLFAATTGLNNLKNIFINLEEKQAALYKPRAKNAYINSSLTQLKKTRIQQKEANIDYEKWQLTKDTLQTLKKEESNIETRLHTVAETLTKNERLYDGLKYISRYRELTSRINELQHLPLLQNNFSENRLAVQINLQHLESEIIVLKEEAEKLEGTCQKIQPNVDILANEKGIETIARMAEVHSKANSDKRNIRSRSHLLKDEATRISASIKKGSTPAEIIKGIPSASTQQEMQTISERLTQLNQTIVNQSNSIKELKQSQQNMGQRLQELKLANTDIGKLFILTELANEQKGKLQNKLELEHDLRLLEIDIKQNIKCLPLWNLGINQLAEIPLPQIATIRKFESHLNELQIKLEHKTNRISELQHRLQELAINFEKLSNHKSIPNRKTLIEMRQNRDINFNDISTYLKVSPDKVKTDDWLQIRHVTTQFSEIIQKTDSISDKLIDDASTIAELDRIKSETYGVEKQLKQVSEEEKLAQENLAFGKNEWRKVWEHTTISTLEPSEMYNWHEQATKLVTAHHDRQKKTLSLEEITAQRTLQYNNLQAVLSELSIPSAHCGTLEELLHCANGITQEAREQLAEKKQLHSALSNSAKQLEILEKHQLETEAITSNLKNQWTSLLNHLGLQKDNTNIRSVFAYINQCSEVEKLLEKIHEFEIRNKAIADDYHKYTARVNKLCLDLAPQLTELIAEEAALELHAKLLSEQEKYKDLKHQQGEREQLQQKLHNKQELLEQLVRQKEQLFHEAQASSFEAIIKVEQQVTELQELKLEFFPIKQQLEELACGIEINAFVIQLSKLDPDNLKVAIEQLESEKKQLQEQQKEIIAKRALSNNELLNITSESDALQFAQEAENLKTNINTAVEEYLVLKTGSVILSQTIEKYRQDNQSPVLEEAGKYFKFMTNSSFTAIKADYDERGEPIIKAEREDGTRLNISQLSDGSRDQLFLCLRLGGLAKQLSQRPTTPFIVDDILVHFDDQRAERALQALQEMSKKTQILFFTHHAHLVRLAKSSLLSGSYQLHTL